MEGPFGFGGVEASAADREGFDEKPHVALVVQPGLGIETVADVGGVRVDLMQRSSYQD